MIKIRNLNKEYGTQKIFNDACLDFLDKGMYAIVGASGSGKTSFLNLLVGVDEDYLGDIIIDHVNVRKMKNIDDYRLKNIGYISQSLSLFPFESIEENILLPFNMSGSSSIGIARKRMDYLVEKLNIKSLIGKKTTTLSYGEKQRVEIVRALINNPKIVICDEPTASLDSYNRTIIMELLYEVSKHALVIIATHEVELIKKYANQIIEIQNNKFLLSSNEIKDNKENKQIPFRVSKSNHKASLPFRFCLHHSSNSMKSKKIRTLLLNFVTSLAFLGVGLSLTLTNMISDSIKESYKNTILDNGISMSLKNKEDYLLNGRYSISEIEANELVNKKDHLIKDYSTYYEANFEQYFPDENDMSIASTINKIIVKGFSIRHVNEYVHLDEVPNNRKFYPERIDNMNNDDIVLAINKKQAEEMCVALRIVKDFSTLGQYIASNYLTVSFNLCNYSWTYSDQQILHVVGIIESDISYLIHQNPQWNKWMFETQMRFPIIDNIDGELHYPWVLKRLIYFRVNSKNTFLKEALFDSDFNQYLFQPLNVRYLHFNHDYFDSSNKFIVFIKGKKAINLSDIAMLKKEVKELGNYHISTNGGYAVYANALISGFAHQLFLSGEKDNIDAIIDLLTSNTKLNEAELVLPANIKLGSFYNKRDDNVGFKVIDESLEINEVYLSSALYNQLNIDKDNNLFLAYAYEEKIDNTGTLRKEFSSTNVKIKGIIESNEYLIYQEASWLITFFLTYLNVDAFDLIPQSVVFSIDSKCDINEIVYKLNEKVAEYKFENPSQLINENIEKICFYIEIVLIGFSLITTLISIITILLSNHINLIETKKDIGLLRYLGASKNDTCRMFFIKNSFTLFLSLITASIELLICSIIINYSLNSFSLKRISISVYPIGFIIMLIMSIFLVLMSHFAMRNKLKKIDPVEALKIY